MLHALMALLLQAGKVESTAEWKKAKDAEEAAAKSDKYADWSEAGEAWLIAAKKLRQPNLQDHGLECLDRAWERADGGNREFLKSRL